MIVAIHQPHFLPWLGYLDRMSKADLFILLDHVQHERQNYQNRVLVKTGEGARWVVVPVRHGGQEQTILDTLIDNQRGGRLRWGRKVLETLRHSYQGTPWFDRHAEALREVFDARWERLVDLNIRLTEILMEALEIRTPLVRSSELGVAGQKSGLVLALCRAVGADTFLGGLGGSRRYLDEAAFERAGIRVIWQEFAHPRYPQHPRKETFIEGLSAVDLLFNAGPESAAILKGKELVYAGQA